jgi:hypothetical protein
MNYPSIFISTYIPAIISEGNYSILEAVGFNIIYKKSLEGKIFIYQNDSILVFAQCSYGFLSLLKSKDANYFESELQIKETLPILQWGFLSIFSKTEKSVVIYNDIYGIYPLYYTKNEQFTISNDFDGLAKMQKSLTPSVMGVYDYLLFNYTLKSHTLFNEINQLEGNSKLFYDVNRIKVFSFDIEILDRIPAVEVGVEAMCDSLNTNVRGNIDPMLPNTAPLTGGFDSKVIISLLLSLGYDFDTFTFGYENSPDHIAAVSTATNLNFSHRFIGMSDEFIQNLDIKLDMFLRNHPNAPMFDTLLSYLSVSEVLAPCNLITGQMGGELIVGPVLISELITTRTFAMLATASDTTSLQLGLRADANQIGFIEMQTFNRGLEDYASSLNYYLKKSDNSNIVNFLLKETYGKFFGVVFSNLFGKFNVVNPLVDIKYLRHLLTSQYRFTNKKPFKKAPFSHFISRRLYPKLIKLMYPLVLKTKMDRGYNLEDFMHWYNFFKPFFNYAKRHLFRKKTITYIPQARYFDEIRKKTLDVLPTSRLLDWSIFDKKTLLQQINEMKSGNATKFQERKLIQLFTLHLIFSRYSTRVKF